MRLGEPAWLGLVLLAFLPWAWGRRRPRVAWPSLDGFAAIGGRRAGSCRAFPWILKGAALACLAVAMARPQSPGGRVREAGRGVAIVALLDRSSSMKAVDFPSPDGPVSRLDAAKATLGRFIEGRYDDLVGLVKFANYPDLDAAPTLDQSFLIEAVRSIRPAGQVDDGTNLGDAIAFGLGVIRDAPTRRKALILITDGRNAPGVPNPVDPLAAAGLARDLGVRLYTIAIGGPVAPGPEADPKPTLNDAQDGPDLALLATMAGLGGGRTFVATDAEMLAGVFREIDTLEKSPVAGTVRTLYREEYAPWAAGGLGLLALDLAWVSGRFRRLP